MNSFRRITPIVLALAALGVSLSAPRASFAQDGPAQQASDQAEANAASSEGPEGLNTAQQARMMLSEGNRQIGQADKHAAKEVAETDAKKKEEHRAKAQKAYESAIQNYQGALKLDPTLVEAYVGLAHLMVKSGKFDQAIQLTEKALELDPDSVKALAAKGRAQLAAFKVTDAKATYDRIAAESAKAGKEFLAEFKTWLDAQRAKLGPEMAQAVADLDNWIKEKSSS